MMSRCDCPQTGTFSRAGFYLPFTSVNDHAYDMAYLSQYDYFPVLSQIKVVDLKATLLFKELKSDLPNIYYESNPTGSSAGYAILANKAIHTISDYPENLSNLRNFLKSIRVPLIDLPFFTGGLIGFWSYDLGLKLLDLPEKNDLSIPKQYFFMPEEIIVYDTKTELLTTIIWIDCNQINDFTYPNIYQRIETIEKLALNLQGLDYFINLSASCPATNSFEVNIPDNEFCTMVEKAKEYIKQGDIFQIVLSRYWKKHSIAKPFDVFLRLYQVNPSPYMFFVNLPELILLGASPETQVLVEGKNVSVSPIAGTRSICGNKILDLEAARELLNDDKELAEHIMLVDLSRNELSKICKQGSVKVEEMFKLKYFSHLVHLVSTVKGSLSDCNDSLAAFASCFPAGTLSGAPKYRAMQIINQLEPMPRGIYGGSVGYINFNGNLDSCIIIRTALYKEGEYIIQSGAGIVADSIPKKECEETFIKAQAILKTIQAVEESYYDFDS